MRPVHRRPPRLLVRQFLVWFAWFVLSGYVFHNKTARDLRRLSVAEILLRLASLAVVLVAVYWLVAIMPANVRSFLSMGLGIGIVLGGAPFFVQATVTRCLEFKQYYL